MVTRDFTGTDVEAIVRPATETDLPRIVEIEADSFATPWPESVLRGHLGEGGFLVYQRYGTVIGYIIVGIRIPSLFARLEKRTRAWMRQPVDLEERTGHIMNLAVDSAHRGRGVGMSLLQQGLRHLARLGAETVELEVRVENGPAIRLYEKHGFVISKRISRYYHGGEDAYLMSRSLR